MNKVLIILASISVFIIIAFFVLGMMSKKGEALGLKEGQLQACTSIENCVVSEVINGEPNTIEAFTFSGDKTEYVDKLEGVIETLGGKVTVQEGDYIATTFTSKIFGYVDDFELRVSDNNLLHFRSASRVGRSDLGANKKRVDAMKLLLSQQ